MSQYSDVTVIDIGSKSISAYVAEYLSKDNFAVKASCEIDYSGYMEGEWLAPDEITPSLCQLLDRLERSCPKIKTVYVGIPADFCTIRTLSAGVMFQKAKRITKDDVKALIDYNNPFADMQNEVISANPISFIADSSEKIEDPVGSVVTSLKGVFSYIGINRKVLDFLRQAFARHGVKTVHFIQSEYEAVMHLFCEEDLMQGVLMIDVGYLATSVMYVTGKGINDLRTFSLGGGMITAGLTQSFSIPFEVATALCERLSLTCADDSVYKVQIAGNSFDFNSVAVNSVVKECLQCLASYIVKSVEDFKTDFPAYMNVYLTGGGIANIRGARDYIERFVGHRTTIICPNVPNYNKPYYSTTVGLILSALEDVRNNKSGLFKLLRK